LTWRVYNSCKQIFLLANFVIPNVDLSATGGQILYCLSGSATYLLKNGTRYKMILIVFFLHTSKKFNFRKTQTRHSACRGSSVNIVLFFSHVCYNILCYKQLDFLNSFQNILLNYHWACLKWPVSSILDMPWISHHVIFKTFKQILHLLMPLKSAYTVFTAKVIIILWKWIVTCRVFANSKSAKLRTPFHWFALGSLQIRRDHIRIRQVRCSRIHI
jgi:hypothetical protein